jgi:predicted Fe-S protein YdhL (DUF1289 family)
MCEHVLDAKKTNCVRCRMTKFEIENWATFSDKQRSRHQRLIDQRRVHLVIGSGEYLVYPGNHYTHVVKLGPDPLKPGKSFYPHNSFDRAARTVDVMTNVHHGTRVNPLHIMELMELPVGMKV